MQFEITPHLLVIGGAACLLLEFLRGLLLRLDDYPRIKAVWEYLPFVFGAVLILPFPSAVPSVSEDMLMLLAHGAVSPTIFVVAYPKLKKQIKQAKGEAPEPPKEPES
jgi:hypothetical protein